ncbi:MAG: hydrogenase maturation nickel metallochaperone HypA [Acidobacteria bacterium]|nr:hydrogenase maturation nickel metallochaperone HypA [Acidobacteriota bacterium]
MHELGVARNILEIVQQSVPEDRFASVKWIRIRIGRLSGVVPDSLEFCFSALLSETKMQQAGLIMENEPIVSLCKDCGHQFTVEDFAFTCPSCNSANLELLSGRELEIVDIELADD